MVRINPWKCFVFGAIGTCICVNVSFLTLSLRKPSVPVDSHPYEAGLKYQESIDSEEEIRKRGWSIVVRRSPLLDTLGNSDKGHTVAFSIKDGNGNAVSPTAVALRAINPAHPEADAMMQLVKNSADEWIGSSILAPGQWLLSWKFIVNQEKFSLNEKRML
jgi:nitrogen fixation protein FixH